MTSKTQGSHDPHTRAERIVAYVKDHRLLAWVVVIVVAVGAVDPVWSVVDRIRGLWPEEAKRQRGNGPPPAQPSKEPSETEQAPTAPKKPPALLAERSVRSPAAIHRLTPDKPVVLVVDSARSIDVGLTSAIATVVAGDSGGLANEFVAGGDFQRAYDGDAAVLARIDGIGDIPMVILGVASARIGANESLGQGLRQVDLDVTLRVFYPRNGFNSSVMQFRATGAGFSNDAAATSAASRVAEQLPPKLK
jgi:hypothetical protein